MNEERRTMLTKTATRIVSWTLAIIAVDALGTYLFLYFQGPFLFELFIEALTLLMLLEGCLIIAAGGFMFFGFTGFGDSERKAAKPNDAKEGQKKSVEKRVVGERLAFKLIALGLLLIFLGFLISAIAYA